MAGLARGASRTSEPISPPPQIILNGEVSVGPSSSQHKLAPPPVKHGRVSKDSISSHDLQMHLPGSAIVED